MNFFTRKTSWSNFELWLYKLASFSGSALIGAYFATNVLAYAKYFFVVFVITAACAAWMWINKMKKEKM
jgi:hypothetical protein